MVTRINPSGRWATKQQVLNPGVTRTTPRGSEKYQRPGPIPEHQNMKSVAQASELLMLSVDSNARLKTSTANWPTRLQEGRDNYSSDAGTWMDANLVQSTLARNILHHFTPVHTSSLSICVMAWKILARTAINNAGGKKVLCPAVGHGKKSNDGHRAKRSISPFGKVVLKIVLQILI